MSVLLCYLRGHGDTSALGHSNEAVAVALGINRQTLARAAAVLQERDLIRVESRQRVGTRYVIVGNSNVVQLRP
jgi:hypothetical protein